MTGSVTHLLGCSLPAAEGEPMRIEIEDGIISAIAPVHAAAASTPDHVVDAAGRGVTAGFIDAHAHVVEAGIERLRCDMSGAADVAETLARIERFRDGSAASWIIGRGWELAHLDEQVRSLALIDRVTGDRPAYLNNANGHCAWVNSAALRAAGIDASTPDPAGGRFGRDERGVPDGMLYESAMNAVADILPPPTVADKRAGLLDAQAELHRFGVTAWHEAIVGPYLHTTDVQDTLRAAVDDGALRSRVNGALWWPRGEGAEVIDLLIEARESFGDDPRLRCTTVKIMYDGTASSRTAAMIDGYTDAPDGDTFFTREQLAEIVAVADDAGFDVHVHANGDRAVRETVDAIAQLDGSGGIRDRRHQIAHLNFVRDQEIRRMADLGIIAVVQPLWGYRSPKLVGHVLGGLREQDASRIYRLGALAEGGVRLASSSDWPVSTPDPWAALHTAVHRSSPDDDVTAPLLPAERLTLAQAHEAATHGAAFALRRETEIGRLRPGMAADLALLDRSWADAAADIGAVSTDLTMIDGEVVYQR